MCIRDRGGSAAIIAGSDTMVAIVAGLMIFPIVFANGLDPAAGSGLIFGALPAVFAGMPAGAIIGALFFFLAFSAALTTSISILITVSAVVVEELGLSRIKSAFAVGVLAWAVGALTVTISGLSGWLEFLSGSVLLPLCGLLVAALAGWVVPRNIMRNELSGTSDRLFKFWRVLIRYLATLAIALILLLGIDEKFNFGLNQLIARLTGVRLVNAVSRSSGLLHWQACCPDSGNCQWLIFIAGHWNEAHDERAN